MLFDDVLMIKLMHFIIPGIFGMIYAYAWRWVEKVKDKSLSQYLFGDKRALIKAILVFIASCAGMLSLDYLSMLDNLHLMIAGLGLGLLIPDKVEARNND